MKYFTIFCFSLFTTLVSCHSDPNPRGTTAALNIPGDTTSVDTMNKASIPTLEFSGRFIPQDDEHDFIICSGQRLIIEDDNKFLKNSYQKNLTAPSYPKESVEAKITGYLKKSASGKGSDTLVVSDLKEVKPKSFQTECYNFEFIAIGNEPFWSLEIIPDENVIALKDVAEAKSYLFSYSRPQLSDDSFLYKITNEKKETLEVIIRKETCNDGMSDRNYHYSASVLINGKPLSGCAIKKGDKL